MKKFLLISALFLSTGLTALSITRDTKKSDTPLKQTTITEKAEAISSNTMLATAD